MNIKLNEYSHPSLTLVVVHSIKKKKGGLFVNCPFKSQVPTDVMDQIQDR
jgi:hypothetical protein